MYLQFTCFNCKPNEVLVALIFQYTVNALIVYVYSYGVWGKFYSIRRISKNDVLSSDRAVHIYPERMGKACCLEVQFNLCIVIISVKLKGMSTVMLYKGSTILQTGK